MDKIFINSNGKQIGPFTIQEVQSRVNTGELVPSDLAFYKGLPNWISVRELLSNSSQVLPPILPDTAKSEKKAWAITGMVLGILSCVNCLLILNTPVIFIGFNDFLWLSALGVPGAVFSHLSIKRNMGGRNMALAGQKCSIIGLAIGFFILIVAVFQNDQIISFEQLF